MLLLIAHVLLLTAQRSLLIAHKIASLPICIALCHARIIYVHSTSSEMARACIHLGVHDHPVSNGTCHESLDIAYQCVANEVTKAHTAKNSAIVMAVKVMADIEDSIKIKL